MKRPLARPLSPIQIKAAGLLARGWTGVKTARELGIRPETVSRWQSRPEFRAEMRRVLELAQAGDTRKRVVALTGPALDVLAAVLASQRAGMELRVEAAAALLGFAAAIGAPDEEEAI